MTCFCGQPDDRERVHRAHECVPWVTGEGRTTSCQIREVRWRSEDGNGVWTCSCGKVGSGVGYPDEAAVAREADAHVTGQSPSSTSTGGSMDENLTPELRESIKRGLDDSAAGRVVDLGSFAQYADEPDDDDA